MISQQITDVWPFIPNWYCKPVCYVDPAKIKKEGDDNNVKPDALTVDLVTRPMNPQTTGRRCDNIYLRVRVITPNSNFKDVKQAEIFRRLLEQNKPKPKESGSDNVLQIMKHKGPSRIDEGKNDIILGKPEVPEFSPKSKEAPISLEEDIQIEESEPESFKSNSLQSKFDQDYERDLEIQQNIRGPVVFSSNSEQQPPLTRQKTVAMDGRNWEDVLRQPVLGQEENGLEICVLGARKKNTLAGMAWVKRKC